MTTIDRALPEALRPLAARREFDAGERVFRAASPARHVFLVVAGAVRLVRYGPDGEEVPIHLAHAGECFAEASLHAERYHCSAYAVRRSTLLAVPSDAVRRLLAADPAFAADWVATLAAQLRRERARVERLCLRGARERVRHLLLTEGTGPRGRYPLRGPVRDLAAELGMTHEALYRTLAAMEASGELSRDRAGLALRR